ncbi:MAG: hypothetical protein IV086_06885 [Hyphomonadaceae bacterium]|nr:MAG: Uncharacterized protein FD160_3151 [Caulobacteraceae bacterium]MBT9445405.1 hypothetical protein [Hyphomonadaceae bacterium]TPW07086.1 MAG: Uncharacterized protein FD124_1401 [Alphaproteobacteria bacterium]
MRPPSVISCCLATIAAIAVCLQPADVALAKAPVAARVLKTKKRGRSTSLTGAWSGEYVYPFKIPGNPMRVPFNADLDDVGGSITGSIDEPNTFAVEDVPRLFSNVVGARTGSRVEFIKTLDGTGGETHSILYEGDISADFDRIEGSWSIPGVWSGAFFMEREGAQVEAAIERAAKA